MARYYISQGFPPDEAVGHPLAILPGHLMIVTGKENAWIPFRDGSEPTHLELPVLAAVPGPERFALLVG